MGLRIPERPLGVCSVIHQKSLESGNAYGKKLKQPVYELMGGAQRGYFQTAESIPNIEVFHYCTIVAEKWYNEAMMKGQFERAPFFREVDTVASRSNP